MARTVFILGAGASKDAGAPLMDEFLSLAQKINLGAQDDNYRQKVFDGIEDLRVIQAKSKIDLDNIENVFGAFEMARILKRLGERDAEQVDRLVHSLKKLIVNTLELSIRCPLSGDIYRPPRTYDRFGEMLFQLRNDLTNLQVSVITLNYDVALEYALSFYGVEYDYVFGNSIPANSISLMKLHGSINWRQCGRCSQIFSTPIMYKPNTFFTERRKGDYCLIRPSKHFAQQVHCNEPIELDAMIIPPTWNKTQYNSSIGQVWVNAAKCMSEADNIFIVGYSLPPSDEFFKYLFALGTMTRTFLDCIWVFNPDESVKHKYDNLIADGIRKKYKYFSKTFLEAIPIIQSKLMQ